MEGGGPGCLALRPSGLPAGKPSRRSRLPGAENEALERAETESVSGECRTQKMLWWRWIRRGEIWVARLQPESGRRSRESPSVGGVQAESAFGGGGSPSSAVLCPSQPSSAAVAEALRVSVPP